jgi:hypothetical protein
MFSFVDAKEFLYITSVFMVQFGELRYERSARIIDHLSIDEFRNNWCEQGLNFLCVNI